MRSLLALLLLTGSAFAADTTPFYPMADPARLAVTTTAQQYQIPQPAEATSFRLTNPCGVDIRLRTASNMTDTVTVDTGTLFLGRTSEVVGTSTLMTAPRMVSVIATSAPAPPGCTIDLLYGIGQ